MKGKKRESGFTLVEVLVSMAVFAIAMLAILGMQVINIQTTSTSSNLTVAADLATDAMEELIGLSFTDPRISTGLGGIASYDVDSDGNEYPDRNPSARNNFDPGGSPVDEYGLTCPPSPSGCIYTRTYYVLPDIPAHPRIKRFLVDVQWPGGGLLPLLAVKSEAEM